MTETQTLLAKYAATGSEAAFHSLVERYIALVRSTALRLVVEAPHLADDVVQIVFVDLARMAKDLPGDVMLGGWLHRHTCFVASKMMRGERRRFLREKKTFELNAMIQIPAAECAEISRHLDNAINKLGAEDRSAILSRYFEQRDLRSVGELLGSTEEGARKRISRALEKLHRLLRREGVTLQAIAISGFLATEAITATPAALAGEIGGAALLASAAPAVATVSISNFFAAIKLPAACLVIAFAASVSTTLWIHAKATEKMAGVENMIHRQTGELTQLSSEVAEPHRANELQDLQTAVAALRSENSDIDLLHEENRELLAHGTVGEPYTQAEYLEKLSNYSRTYGSVWREAFTKYSEKHNGRFPTSFQEAVPLLPDDWWLRRMGALMSQDDWEIVVSPATKMSDRIEDAGKLVLLRQKVILHSPENSVHRGYVTADGPTATKLFKNDEALEIWEVAHQASTQLPP